MTAKTIPNDTKSISFQLGREVMRGVAPLLVGAVLGAFCFLLGFPDLANGGPEKGATPGVALKLKHEWETTIPGGYRYVVLLGMVISLLSAGGPIMANTNAPRHECSQHKACSRAAFPPLAPGMQDCSTRDPGTAEL